MAKATTAMIPIQRTPEEEQRMALENLSEALVKQAPSIKALLKFAEALEGSGLLEMGTALLDRGGNILEIIVHQAEKPEAVGMVKNLFALMSAFGQMDMSKVAVFATEASKALDIEAAPKVDSVWDLLKALQDPDVQRGISMGLGVLKALGQVQTKEDPMG